MDCCVNVCVLEMEQEQAHLVDLYVCKKAEFWRHPYCAIVVISEYAE